MLISGTQMVVPKRHNEELERLEEEYNKKFGEPYPYLWLTLGLNEAIADIKEIIKSDNPVKESEYQTFNA
jgi:predicted nucleotidyltransferase